MTAFRFTAADIQSNRDIALALCAAGVRVFPCDPRPKSEDPRSKSPLIREKWQTVPLGNASWVEDHWRRRPDAVPGIELGAQNIAVIDTDGIEGQRQWAAYAAPHGGDGGGPRTFTPNGVHIFYRVPEGLRIGNGLGSMTPKKQGGMIDVRGPGMGYVIAPASTMSDGDLYHPQGDDPLAFLQAPEMPAWVVSLLTDKAPQEAQAHVARPISARPVSTVRKEAWADAAFDKEIAAVAGAGEGSRNSTLNTAAFSLFQLVEGGLLDAGAVWNALIGAADQNGSLAEDRREVEQTILSGERGGRAKPRSSPPELDDDDGIDYAAIADRITNRRTEVSPSGSVHDAETGEVVPGRGTRPPFPAHLTRPPGLVGWIVDWIEASATMPSRAMALAAAVTVVGTAMGRYWCGPTASTQTLYVVAMGPTGSGKEHPMRCADLILSEAQMDDRVGGTKFTSSSGLYRQLMDSPASLSCIDEFGDFLRRINSARASGFEREITALMREVWSTNCKWIKSQQKAGAKSEKIFMPQLSVLGMTTADQFFQAINGSEDVQNGLVNRMLLINIGSRPKAQEPRVSDALVPAAIINGVRGVWCAGNPDLQSISNNYTEKPNLQKIPWHSDDVRIAFSEFQAAMLVRSDADTRVAPFLVRIAETALRLAAIVSTGQNTTKPTLTMGDWEWGRDFATWCYEELIYTVGLYVSDTDAQRKANDVKRIVIEAGGALKKRDMLRKLQHRYGKRELADVMESMQDSGTIAIREIEGEAARKTSWVFLSANLA